MCVKFNNYQLFKLRNFSILNQYEGSFHFKAKDKDFDARVKHYNNKNRAARKVVVGRWAWKGIDEILTFDEDGGVANAEGESGSWEKIKKFDYKIVWKDEIIECLLSKDHNQLSVDGKVISMRLAQDREK